MGIREHFTTASLGLAAVAVAGGILVAGAAFVRFGTRGPILSMEPAVGSIALAAAGANRLLVLGYATVGIERLYLTALPVALAVTGVAVGSVGRRWSLPLAVLLGMAAVGTLTVLGGCPCGSGSTAFLAERAVRRTLTVTTSLVILSF